MAGDLYCFDITCQEVRHGLRVVRHPSESLSYLLCRVLAYVLHYEPGMAFGPGVCRGEEPAVFCRDGSGALSLWVDINNPGERKLRVALRRAERVLCYLYRDEEAMKKLLASLPSATITVYQLEWGLLDTLATGLARRTSWEVALEGDVLVVNGMHGRRRLLSSS